MNQEKEDQFIQSLENMTNGTVGCNEQDWKDLSPKARNVLFKHIYEFEFDEAPPDMDVSIVSWNALPERFVKRLKHNTEEYAKAVYECEHNL